MEPSSSKVEPLVTTIGDSSNIAHEKDETEHIRAGGSLKAIGDEYHLLFLMIIMLQAYHENLDFQIAIEYGPAGKFDDIYIRFINKNGEREDVFFQVKHTISDKELDIQIQHLIKVEQKINKQDKTKKEKPKYELLDFLNDYIKLSKNEDMKNIKCFLFANTKWNYDKKIVQDFFRFFKVEDIDNKIDPFISKILKPNLIQLSNTNCTWINEVKNTTIENIQEFTNAFYIAQDQKSSSEMETELIKTLSDLAHKNNTLGKIMFENLLGQVQTWFNDSEGNFKNKTFVHDFISSFVNNPRFYYRHELRQPNKHFTGRENELHQINTTTSSIKEEGNIIDVAIIGMSGFGKTQLLLKYLHENENNYTQIIWINSEKIFQNFVNIGKQFGIIYDSNKMTQEELITTIYSCFYKNHRPIIIFDGAKDIESIKKYLPEKQKCPIKIFVSSNNINWPAEKIIKLEVFTEDESLQLAHKILGTTMFTDSEIQQLASTLGHYPLALHLAYSLINAEVQKNQEYKIQDFLDAYNDEPIQLHDMKPSYRHYNSYQRSLLKIWILNKSNLEKIDMNALEIIKILSYCDPNSIPIELLDNLDKSKEIINTSIELLKTLSIIDIRENFIFIHNLLQNIITEDMKENKESKDILSCAMNLCDLQKVPLSYDKYSYYFPSTITLHAKKMWLHATTLEEKSLLVQYIHHPSIILQSMNTHYMYKDAIEFANIPIETLEKYNSDKYFDILKIRYFKAEAYHIGGLYTDSLNELELIIKILKSKLPDQSDEEIKLQHIITSLGSDDEIITLILHIYNKLSTTILKLGNNEKALNICNEIIEIIEEKYDIKNYDDYYGYLGNRASVLNSMSKHVESLEDYVKVLDYRLKNLKKTNVFDVLTEVSNMAGVIEQFGLHEVSLINFNFIIEKQTTFLGIDHPSTLTTLNNRGVLLQSMGQFNKALTDFDYILEIVNKKFGTDHPFTLTILNNKANILTLMQKHEDALKIFDHVLDVRKEIFEDNHPSVITSKLNKAAVLREMGKYLESVTLFHDIFCIAKESLGYGHKITLMIIGNIAGLFLSMGKYKEALSFFEMWLKLTNDFKNITYNPIHKLQIESERALTLRHLGKLDDALQILDEVIPEQKLKIGINHPSTISSISNRGIVLQSLGRYPEALDMYNELLDTDRVKNKIDNIDIDGILGNKALILTYLGQYKESIEMFNTVIENQTIKLGEYHPTTLISKINRSNVLRILGKPKEAIESYDDYYTIAIDKLGELSSEIISMISNRADALNELGKYEEALTLYNEAYEKNVTLLGASHQNTMITMANRALLFHRMEQSDKACEEFDNIIQMYKEKLSIKHPDTLNAMNNKGIVYLELDKYDEAYEIFNEILPLYKQILGEKHPTTLVTLNNISVILLKQNKYEEALINYEYLVKLNTEILGDKNPNTLNSMHNKAFALQELGRLQESQDMFKLVYEKNCEIFGTDHKASINTLSFITKK